jgi:CRP/FNR family transcriptional regulator
VLAILQPLDTFNEVPVFDGGVNPATVETIEPSTVAVVPRETALALIGRSPHAALTLLASFAARLRGFTQLVEALAFDDVNRRLARFIAQLARTEGDVRPDGVVIARSLTVQDVAAMVGSVREVVTRGLAHLDREGLIHVSRDQIVVLDLDALERFGED